MSASLDTLPTLKRHRATPIYHFNNFWVTFKIGQKVLKNAMFYAEGVPADHHAGRTNTANYQIKLRIGSNRFGTSSDKAARKSYHTEKSIFHIKNPILWQTPRILPSVRRHRNITRECFAPLKAGGKPSTWLPPGGLVERVATN